MEITIRGLVIYLEYTIQCNSLLNKEKVHYVEVRMEEYVVPDEHLSCSELKEKIIEECAKTLPEKKRILLMAKKLEEDLTLNE